jgi:hypothetical protein
MAERRRRRRTGASSQERQARCHSRKKRRSHSHCARHPNDEGPSATMSGGTCDRGSSSAARSPSLVVAGSCLPGRSFSPPHLLAEKQRPDAHARHAGAIVARMVQQSRPKGGVLCRRRRDAMDPTRAEGTLGETRDGPGLPPGYRAATLLSGRRGGAAKACFPSPDGSPGARPSSSSR